MAAAALKAGGATPAPQELGSRLAGGPGRTREQRQDLVDDLKQGCQLSRIVRYTPENRWFWSQRGQPLHTLIGYPSPPPHHTYQSVSLHYHHAPLSIGLTLLIGPTRIRHSESWQP